METEKQTLSDLLSTMSDDELIFLGAKTAWFFIGTVEEYRRYEKAIDLMLEEYWQQKIDDGKKNLQNLLMSYLDDIKNERCSHKNPETDGFALSTRYRTLCEDIERRDDFLPIEVREVKMSYPRIEEGTGIVLDGHEVGDYWDTAEWEERKGRKKLEKFMEELNDEQQ